MKRPRVLLYAPDVVGHPRVYCRAIADALAAQHCEILVALGFTDEVGLSNSPDLQPLVSRERVRILDNRQYSTSENPHLLAEELVSMQTTHDVDVTLFIEADKFNQEFKRIAAARAPRLKGRNIGIFANTAEWYPGEDSFTGERIRLRSPRLRTTLGNIKRLITDRKKRPRYFFEKTIIRSGLLDEIWVKDERLADWRGAPVRWMPEISRPAKADEAREDSEEFNRRQAELRTFLSGNVGREPLLYFGDAAFYKGYDLFLEFISENISTCAIHAGRSYDLKQLGYFRSDVVSLRERLRTEGRLYETNGYVHGQRVKELYFGAIRVYITTHRLALSSSTMIQAAEMGKPVLVPDRGLIGYRVQRNGLGAVYRYEDLGDLRRKAEALWGSDLTRFAEPVATFWSRFNDDAIQEFFVTRLLQP